MDKLQEAQAREELGMNERLIVKHKIHMGCAGRDPRATEIVSPFADAIGPKAAMCLSQTVVHPAKGSAVHASTLLSIPTRRPTSTARYVSMASLILSTVAFRRPPTFRPDRRDLLNFATSFLAPPIATSPWTARILFQTHAALSRSQGFLCKRRTQTGCPRVSSGPRALLT